MNKIIFTASPRRSGVTYRCVALAVGLTTQAGNTNILLFSGEDSVYQSFRAGLGESMIREEDGSNAQYILSRNAHQIKIIHPRVHTETYLYSADMLTEAGTHKYRDFMHLLRRSLDSLQEEGKYLNIIATENVSQDVINMVTRQLELVKEPFTNKVSLYV
ncbi:hypothetical protein [Yersinia ruckeri]|uniref:hypothetical protein n=1 Tax=Yersinia ruckeri TaxID=29486 RepID=UPI0022373E05|nr:hypothetical protein [Yersinia ruckeri]MCW6598694.1 hypothetical protein [Yersinia ruckeri]